MVGERESSGWYGVFLDQLRCLPAVRYRSATQNAARFHKNWNALRFDIVAYTYTYTYSCTEAAPGVGSIFHKYRRLFAIARVRSSGFFRRILLLLLPILLLLSTITSTILDY
jgi:hypothetical protein